MENDILTQIIEKGGTISWKDKYFLDFMDYENYDPDKSWSGYEIVKLDDNGFYHRLYSSIKLEETLNYFDEIINENTRNDFITHYGER